MGLASYGKPKYYDLILNNLIDVKEDGSIHLNMQYFAFTYDKIMTNKKFSKLFGIERRKENEKTEQIHYDIGASAQKVLEDILLKMVNHLYNETKMKNLCLGGGVALNGVANFRIFTEGQFDNVHIPPSPGDGGSAVGCAQYLYYIYHNNTRIIEHNHAKRILEHCYVGPAYSAKSIKIFLDSKNIKYEALDTDSLLPRTAKLISEGNVVGWFQGKLEWGPRALGNRSILADPRNSEMKDIVNIKIKFREPFRPFAPSVLEDKADEYFHIPDSSRMLERFMLSVVNVKDKYSDTISAVNHLGTARVQTVYEDTNTIYFNLIKSFYNITGVPMFLNTSFNVRGEPIVTSPQDAINTFLNSGIDTLVIGRFVIDKT